MYGRASGGQMLLTQHIIQSSRTRTTLPSYLFLTVGYVIAGGLGLMLAVPPGYASAIFPPAGIAVAAMLVLGRTTLPWTLLGSFLLNLWIGYSLDQRLDEIGIAVASVIGLASMAQAAVGGLALRHAIGSPPLLDNGRDLLRFFLLSPLCCLTSATLSLSGMWALGAIKLPDLAQSWLAWWIGDTLGVLVVLPLILVIASEPRQLWRSRALPAAVPMLLFFALFVAIFARVSAWESDQSLLEFRMRSQQIADRLHSRFEEQELFLEQLASSFSNRAPPSREDFRALVQTALNRFTTIQAIEWAPRIEAADRATFERSQSKELLDFAITERGPSGKLSRAGDRARY